MQKLGLNEIREKYLSFFEDKGHLRLASFPLVPQNDKSLLLINAGMAPLKSYFTGKEIPPSARVTTCQKCIRTPDIERVGKTARHGTFFEMLGNFSFGDYFKKEAIAWAWEFITVVLALPKDRLWITIYTDDDEAFEIWNKEEGVPADRIVRLGKEDNFWEIGLGPCGPCSEIHFDRGEEHSCGLDCKIGCDCDRFVEFWNLVFTQFDRDEDGNYNKLKNPNIDTGMGLERIAAIMQGVGNLFEVDTVKNIMGEIIKHTGVTYGEDELEDISLRVITDHIRSTTFMISDNISPSNEGRGYVLRRLLRRAARHGKLLGVKEPFLYKVAEVVICESEGAYPELGAKKDYIKKIIRTEEERFNETIDIGISILEGYIDEMKKSEETVLDGGRAFKLYDTYGFPIDLTIEILNENGMQADRESFEAEMNMQRERARAARAAGESAGWNEDAFSSIDKSRATEFFGYDNFTGTGSITAIVIDGEMRDIVRDGDNAAIIFDRSVFYGESGGQVGDIGTIDALGFSAQVYDCKKRPNGVIVHFANVLEGTAAVGDTVSLSVDEQSRRAVQRNHSATHLLHKALKEVLGTHVSQAGSYVTSGRMRFDFNHFEAVCYEQLQDVERRVNHAILKAMPTIKTEMSMESAVKTGAVAQFGEKYGDVVRVVSMGDYSTELCGGCHVNNTSEIALFVLLSESSAAAGVRRIEGITGEKVLEHLKSLDSDVKNTADILKTNPAELRTKAKAVAEHARELERENAQIRAKLALGALDEKIANVKTINGINVLCASFNEFSADELRQMGDRIKEKIKTGVAVLASVADEKITFIATATPDAVSAGVHAGNIIREVAKIAGGGGGGKPDSAQAGGKFVDKVDDALAVVENIVSQQTKA